VSGGSIDWAKGVAKTRLAYLIELPPGLDDTDNGFIVPPREIQPTGDETFEAIAVVADSLIDDKSMDIA
jgi:hypothetical protein